MTKCVVKMKFSGVFRFVRLNKGCRGAFSWQTPFGLLLLLANPEADYVVSHLYGEGIWWEGRTYVANM